MADGVARGSDGLGKRAAHHVYLIAWADMTKVGRSRAPQSRLASLQTGSPVPLRLHSTWAMDGLVSAAAFELRMHRALEPLRSEGEWFRASCDWVEAIGSAVLHGEQARAAELVSILLHRAEAARLADDLEDDGEPEEADVWRGVVDGYDARARRLGVAVNEWDIALGLVRAA